MRMVSGLSSILGDFHHSPTSTPETQGRKKNAEVPGQLGSAQQASFLARPWLGFLGLMSS